MPRRKTFRKRRQKRIQKGGAPRTISNINSNAELPEFDNNTQTKYYGMARKTRKSGVKEPEYEYESYIVNQAQKDAICTNPEDAGKIMVNNSPQGDNFQQFALDPMDTKTELITFFEFANGAGDDKTLQQLEIKTVADINWTTYVGCNP